MKKLFLTWLTLLLTMGLYANPNPPLEVYINELMFTGSSGWNMELSMYFTEYYIIDSMVIQSGTGSARVTNGNWNDLDQDYKLFYFTDQDLSKPLTINPIGDTVSVILYANYPWPVSSGFSFGNYPHAVVIAPLTGQSMARFVLGYLCNLNDSIYSLTSNPTMGLANDTTGALSTIKGIVYDMYGNPVPNETFIMDFNFMTNSTGQFSTRIYSRNQTWNTLCYQRWPGHFEKVTISPVSYSIMPDTVLNVNINLLAKIITGIPPESENTGQDFKVFPNPVKNLIMVSYSTDLGTGSDDLSLIIYDISGKQVLEKKMENSLGVANIPVDLANGMYLAALKDKGKTLGTAHFVVDK
ncbi:MAG: T9SS type A sorting domain-containing protein [Bacteroidales bacterium]|jgi:hypothetical protein